MRVLLAASVLASAPLMADELLTIRTSDDWLRIFDTDTLGFTDLGPLGVPFDFGDLAWDGEKLYMVQGFAGTGFYEVDPNTGQAIFIGNHGFGQMFGLAFDPTTDKLYGSLSTTGQGFYEIDRTTGQATFIGNPGFNLDALSYDKTRDVLVGAWAGPGSLWEMNRANGQGSLLFDGDFFNNCGMTYVPSDDLHWMIDWSGEVYTFDPNNGYIRSYVTNVGDAHDSLIFLDFDIGGCAPDCNNDGNLDILDFVCFQGLFQNADPAADCDGDGAFTILDFVCFQQAFQGGC